MSSAAILRAPTWQGLQPPLPHWDPVDPAEEAWLLGLCGLEGRAFALSFGGSHRGMYRLAADRQRPIFLKAIPPDRRAAAERAEAIAAWLAPRGACVAHALPGFPKLLPDGGLLVALDYMEGRRVEPVLEDIQALARELGRLHGLLALHPGREEWAEHTCARLEELTGIRAALASGKIVAGPRPDRLRDLAADARIDFATREACQPLHGDLNPGNLLLKSNAACVLDFEDVFHSVLPVRFELALAIERFVLVGCDDETAVRLGRAFLETYRASAWGAECRFDPVATLRSLALRSLCVLSLAESRATLMPEIEWEKFFWLEEQAVIRASTLQSMFDGGEQ